MDLCKCEMAVTLYIFWITLLTGVLEATECKPESLHMILFLGGTANMNEGEQMELLAMNITSKLPDGSTVSVNSAGDRVYTITTQNKPYLDLKWVDKLRSHADMRQHGGTISSAAIDRKLIEQFSVSQYKRRAEIVVLLVNSATKLDSISQLLTKKKTFVVVFGPSNQSIWKTAAMWEDHFYLVRDKNDLGNVTTSLISQIYCDSKYYCDTDMYSPEKGYKCRSCSNVCAQDLTELSGTCGLRCPYLRLKSQMEAFNAKSTSPTTHTYVGPAVQDNKSTVVYVTGSAIGAIAFLILIGVAAYCIKKKKILTPSSSHQTLAKTLEPQTPQTTPPYSVEESRKDHEEQTPFIISRQEDLRDSMHEDSLHSVRGECFDSAHGEGLDSVHSGESDSSRGDGSGPSIAHSEEACMMSQSGDGPLTFTFKNKQELDLNAHFSGDNVYNVHEKPTQRTNTVTAGPDTQIENFQ